MSADVTKFWMVHGIGQGAPRYCHAKKADAQAEAARLAQQCPGIIFVVLAAVDAYMAPQPQVKLVPVVKRPPLADDGIPF